MLETYDFTPGTTPLIVSLPHGGTHIPDVIASQMTEAALQTPDTDWHVGLLYDFAPVIGAGVISATHSRYVIDLNRDSAGAPLYSGQITLNWYRLRRSTTHRYIKMVVNQPRQISMNVLHYTGAPIMCD